MREVVSLVYIKNAAGLIWFLSLLVNDIMELIQERDEVVARLYTGEVRT